MALEPCTGCGEPVWPENNPCDRCQRKQAKTEQAETPASSSPRPKKVQGATSRKG